MIARQLVSDNAEIMELFYQSQGYAKYFAIIQPIYTRIPIFFALAFHVQENRDNVFV